MYHTFVKFITALKDYGGNITWGKTSSAKMEKGLFDFFASRKTKDCRQHFATVDFEELILLF